MRGVRAHKCLCQAPARGFDLPGEPFFSFNVDKKGGIDVQEPLFGPIANNEPYSRVIVLLWKCENFAPAVYPAAGPSPKRPPTEKHNTAWDSADEFPKYPALQERKSGLLYSYSLGF